MFYTASYNDGYQTANCTVPSHYKVLRKFLTEEITALPDSFSIEIRETDDGKLEKYSENPWMGPYVLLLRKSTEKVNLDYLIENGEIFEVPCLGEDGLLLFRASLIDALDIEKSSIKYFPGSQRIMKVEKYSFDVNKLTGINIFRLPMKSSPIFFSDEAISTLKLSATVFQKLN